MSANDSRFASTLTNDCLHLQQFIALQLSPLVLMEHNLSWVLKNFDATSSIIKLSLILTTSSGLAVSFSVETTSNSYRFDGVCLPASATEVDIPSSLMVHSSSHLERREGILVTANSSEIGIVAVVELPISLHGSNDSVIVVYLSPNQGKI